MLVLTRRPGEALLLNLDPGADPDTTLRELFARGPIAITLLRQLGNQVQIGINAPRAISIMREEIANDE